MDINSIGSVATALSQAGTGDAVAIAVLKKSLEIQAQSAMQLIQALPQQAPSNPSNLGNGINVYA